MEYKNIDFNADKVKQYETVREAMARIYEDEPTFFGHLLLNQCQHLRTIPKSWELRANKRPNCDRSNAPIFTIRALGAILILLKLFVRNFILGAEANIPAQAEIRHVIATKFQKTLRIQAPGPPLPFLVAHLHLPLSEVDFFYHREVMTSCYHLCNSLIHCDWLIEQVNFV